MTPEAVLDKLIVERLAENIVVRVGREKQILYEARRGEADEHTLFDMASITKIMATTTLALIAFDRGLLSQDSTVREFFPSCQRKITVEQLLTHTGGVGYGRLRDLCRPGDDVGERIAGMPPLAPAGTQVQYSCLGFILMAKILERVYAKPLDAAFDELVARPLGLTETTFSPAAGNRIVNANQSKNERGIVNDPNARFLNGIAGNAGLFSTLDDLTIYVAWLLRRGAPILREAVFLDAIRCHADDGNEARALGFVYVDKKYPQTAELFPDGSIGHCGHTGQSVFVDPHSGFYVIILSDATRAVTRKFGYDKYDEVMTMRAALHAALKEDLSL